MPGGGVARPRTKDERDFRIALGRCLAEMRHARKLSQSAIRRRTGLSVECISRLENGQENPTILTLRELAILGLLVPLNAVFKSLK